MRERPILFSGEMVRAILAGKKTQTRRLVNPQPVRTLPNTKAVGRLDLHRPSGWKWRDRVFAVEWSDFAESIKRYCPYGVAGDRLWVRECWRPEELTDGTDGIGFRADNSFAPIANTAEAAERWVAAAKNDHSIRWRPSIHMPRWASRINLDVTGVRLERLQDITTEDIAAEGMPIDYSVVELPYVLEHEQREAFRELWDGLNAKRCSWESNPFVWAVSFRRVVCEIQPKALAMENVPGMLSMTTPEGASVVDELCAILERGDFAEFEAMRRLLTGGDVRSVRRGATCTRKKRKKRDNRGHNEPAPQGDLFAKGGA